MAEALPEWMALVNLGAQAQIQKRFQEAIEHYDRALAINSDIGGAYFNRGMCQYWLGHYDSVMPDFQHAVALESTNAEMLQKIAVIMKKMDDNFNAIQLLSRALEFKPDSEEMWLSLAGAYDRIGNTEAARKMYAHLAQKFPHNPIILLQQAYILPAIPSSREEIEVLHEQFIQNLDRLMQQNLKLELPETQIYDFPFYHAYHAKNNVRIASKLSEFFYSSCPSLKFVAPHCERERIPGKKIRVGFLSEFMHKITLNQFWLRLLEGFAALDDFEVLIFSDSAATVEAAQQLDGKISKFVTFKKTLPEIRQQIAAEELDVLIYLEIGMAVKTYFLAHARLAPVQCVMAGHPVTTGIKTMDYFFSAKILEPENGQEHYTEKMVPFERAINYFMRPKQPENILSRQALGLPDKQDAHLYCCPVMLFKIHPDMDRIFASILQRDPKAIIVLFDSFHRTLWRASLEKRFASIMSPELCARITFLPHAPPKQFPNFLSAMDAILDTVHFSFGTTAYLCLGANVPFVTLPGEFARGRGGYTLYKYMDMDDLIATSEEDYVRLAVKLANNDAFQKEVTHKIRERSDLVFANEETVNLLADTLRSFVT